MLAAPAQQQSSEASVPLRASLVIPAAPGQPPADRQASLPLLSPQPLLLSQLSQQLEEESEEAVAVKAFIKSLPAGGIGRGPLALSLLQKLATPGSAAALTPSARRELLQVAHHAQHDMHDTLLRLLPPGHLLVLGELFADAAAAVARSAATQPRGGGPPSAAGSGRLIARTASGRGERGKLSAATLQQSAQLWLSRYCLAAAGKEDMCCFEADKGAADEWAEGGAAAAAAAAAAAPGGGPLVARRLSGMARYWWAAGRVLESAGDMPAASAAYAATAEVLELDMGEMPCYQWRRA